MRRFFVLFAAMCALMSGCVCRAELLCINTAEYVAILTRDGEEVVPPGIYDAAFCLMPGSVYAVGKNTGEGMLYAMCGADGNELTGFCHEMLSPAENSILFRRDGLLGAMDLSGNVTVEPVYTQLAANGEGGYLAMRTDIYDDDPDEILYIDNAGRESGTGVYSAEGLSEISDNRMPFRAPATENYGYVDGMGRVALEASLSFGGGFEGGLARASVNDLFGVIAPSGDWLVAPKYSFIEIGDSVIVGLLGRETCVVWDRKTCSELFRVDGRELNVSLAGDYPVIAFDERVCVYAPDGSLLAEADGKASVVRGAGDQLILSDGDWGAECVSILGADGVRLERKDRHLLALDDERYAFLTMNVAAYNSQALGDIRYSCDYDSIRYGMLNTEGEEILPAEYLEIRKLAEKRYLLLAEDGERVVDENGAEIWSRLILHEQVAP